MMIPDTSMSLNDILMLKQSETAMTESHRLGQYQLEQLGDAKVVTMVVEDMSRIISSVTSKLSNAAFNLCDNIHTYLTDSVKYIEKNRNMFDAIPDNFVDFYIEGYNFSVLGSPRINFSELDSVVNGYNKFMANMNQILQDITTTQPSSAVLDQLELYLSDENLSSIRASMLGQSTPVSGDNFIIDAKRFYRSGRSKTQIIHVHKPDVIKSIDSISKIKADIEQTKKEFNYMNSKCNSAMESIRTSICSIMNAQGKQFCMDIPLGGTVDNNMAATISMCTSIMNAKYSQIVALRNIAEVILRERLMALQDQIRQSVELLNVCMIDAKRKKVGDDLSVTTPTIKSISGKPAQLYTMPLTEVTDYMEASLDQSIICEAEYKSIIDYRYVQEMEFIRASLDSQKIVLMEAGTSLSERYQNLKESFIKFIDNIVATIHKKIVTYNMRYIPWLDDIGEEAMQKKARNMTSITMAPYYDGDDIVGDLRQITAEIQKAAKPTDKNSLDFTKKFIDGVDTQEKYDEERGNIPGYLKNYFRFHKKNSATVKKEEVSGADLANKVSNMMKYIKNYENNTKSLENLSKTVERTVSSMDVVMDSFNYLQLLECFAGDSELGLLEGYQILLEDTNATFDDKEKTGTVTNDKGESESPTSIETPEQKEKKEAEKRGEKPAKSSKYANTFQHFFQLVIGAYVTAAEERFINYVNILSSLSGVRPTVDKNGKYIPQNKKDKPKKEEPSQESVLPQRLYDKPSTMKGASMYKL